jgi:hypothetical protein
VRGISSTFRGKLAARLVDDDHDCDLTEELEYACEMATLFHIASMPR